MQDRYVGDVGDFAKYGLLRQMTSDDNTDDCLRLGVIWYLVDSECNNEDGRHISYLSDQRLRRCDPQLHSILMTLVHSVGHRMVSEVEARNVLPSGTVFYSERLAMHRSIDKRTSVGVRLAHRRDWFERAVVTVQGCDLVFLDPDNGLETPSVPRGSAKSHKYVFVEEIGTLLANGHSVIAYHHLNRTAPSAVQIALGLRRLGITFSQIALIAALTFRRGSARTFFVLAARNHGAFLRRRLRGLMQTGWGAFFELRCTDKGL